MTNLDSIFGEGNGTPLQYSCLENPMDGGAWCAAVHGVARSQTRLSDFTFTYHFHASEKEMATHSSVLAQRIPGTGGGWWAAVYGVAQSRTRLMRLSSSSSKHFSQLMFSAHLQGNITQQTFTCFQNNWFFRHCNIAGGTVNYTETRSFHSLHGRGYLYIKLPLVFWETDSIHHLKETL